MLQEEHNPCVVEIKSNALPLPQPACSLPSYCLILQFKNDDRFIHILMSILNIITALKIDIEQFLICLTFHKRTL
jgi:hypothetical protein